MNIGIVSPRYSNNYWNGTGRVTHAFANGLRALGHSVTVYAYNASAITKKYKDNGVDLVNVGGISSHQDKFGIMFEDVPRWNEKLKQELAGESFNVLVCFDWYGFEACEWFKKITETPDKPMPIIGLVGALGNGRGQYVPFSNQIKVDEYLANEMNFLKNCDELVAFNEGSISEVERLVETSCSLVHLSTQPIDVTLTPEDGNVFIQGRIARERNLERAVRAAADLSWITLIICGSGLDTQYGEYISKLITRCDVKDRVEFKGWKADIEVPPLYCKAEIVCCSSIYDPFGYSALDAMAFGVPVIGSYESYRGVIEDRQTGLLFQSITELKDGLHELHSNKELRTKLATQAKESLAQTRTVAKSVEEFHVLLMDTIDRKVVTNREKVEP